MTQLGEQIKRLVDDQIEADAATISELVDDLAIANGKIVELEAQLADKEPTPEPEPEPTPEPTPAPVKQTITTSPVLPIVLRDAARVPWGTEIQIDASHGTFSAKVYANETGQVTKLLDDQLSGTLALPNEGMHTLIVTGDEGETVRYFVVQEAKTATPDVQQPTDKIVTIAGDRTIAEAAVEQPKDGTPWVLQLKPGKVYSGDRPRISWTNVTIETQPGYTKPAFVDQLIIKGSDVTIRNIDMGGTEASPLYDKCLYFGSTPNVTVENVCFRWASYGIVCNYGDRVQLNRIRMVDAQPQPTGQRKSMILYAYQVEGLHIDGVAYHRSRHWPVSGDAAMFPHVIYVKECQGTVKNVLAWGTPGAICKGDDTFDAEYIFGDNRSITYTHKGTFQRCVIVDPQGMSGKPEPGAAFAANGGEDSSATHGDVTFEGCGVIGGTWDGQYAYKVENARGDRYTLKDCWVQDWPGKLNRGFDGDVKTLPRVDTSWFAGVAQAAAERGEWPDFAATYQRLRGGL